MRTFTSNFLAQAALPSNAPYLVLEIQWGGAVGTKYYLDRLPDQFEASGDRCPMVIDSPLVVSWGEIGLTLKEMEIGTVDALTLRIADDAGKVTRDLTGETPQQRKLVKIYRMFDHSSVEWGTDEGCVFVGTTKPFGWTESDNVVTIEVEDASRLLTRSLDCPASVAVFENVTPEYQDRNIPTVWGRAERVEAILVDAPWETRITEEVNLGQLASMEIELEDHPDDLNIPINAMTGESAELSVYIGRDGMSDGVSRAQAFKGIFHLSADKSTTPSTFEVTEVAAHEYYDMTVTAVANSGTANAIASLDLSGLASDVLPLFENNVEVTSDQSGTFRWAIVFDAVGTGPTSADVMFTGNVDFAENIQVGDVIRGYYRRPYVAIDSVDTPGATTTTFYIREVDILPGSLLESLVTMYGNQIPFAEINQGSGYEPFNIWSIEEDNPIPGTYKLSVHEDYCDPGVYAALAAGDVIRFPIDVGMDVKLPAGSIMCPVLHDWTYACNSLPSKAVHKVEGYGFSRDQSGEGYLDFTIIEQYRTVTVGDPEFGVTRAKQAIYTIDRNNNDWNTGTGLSDDLGRNITTITFQRAPRKYYPELTSNRLFVTLSGVETTGNGNGTLINNAARVIEKILDHTKLLSIDAAYIDDASFDDTAALLTTRLVGFAQKDAVDGLTLVQDIARQCSCHLLFDQGKVSLHKLYNSVSSTSMSLSEENILEGTFQRSETDVRDLISRLTANWRYQWCDETMRRTRKITAVNQGVEQESTLMWDGVPFVSTREHDVYLYGNRKYVVEEITFWLERWSRVYRECELTTFLAAVKLQPGDWVTLSYTQGVLDKGTDLVQESSTEVSSPTHEFGPEDVGLLLTIMYAEEGGHWTVGSYVIESVDAGVATLASACGDGSVTAASLLLDPEDEDFRVAGTWKLGGQQIVPETNAEVLEVKDQGITGLMKLKVRYQQYTF